MARCYLERGEDNEGNLLNFVVTRAHYERGLQLRYVFVDIEEIDEHYVITKVESPGSTKILSIRHDREEAEKLAYERSKERGQELAEFIGLELEDRTLEETSEIAV